MRAQLLALNGIRVNQTRVLGHAGRRERKSDQRQRSKRDCVGDPAPKLIAGYIHQPTIGTPTLVRVWFVDELARPGILRMHASDSARPRWVTGPRGQRGDQPTLRRNSVARLVLGAPSGHAQTVGARSMSAPERAPAGGVELRVDVLIGGGRVTPRPDRLQQHAIYSGRLVAATRRV